MSLLKQQDWTGEAANKFIVFHLSQMKPRPRVNGPFATSHATRDSFMREYDLPG